MAIDSYTSLIAAIPAWMERTGDAAFATQIDNFISLAEAAINRQVNSYRREAEDTITTNSSGEGALPADLVDVGSIVSTASSRKPLRQVTWATLRQSNPSNVSGIACEYAISGPKFRTGPIEEGDFILTYAQKLTPLSGSETTNWLLDLAPDVYLFECLAQGHAFNENFIVADGWHSRAMAIIDELVLQGQLTQYGNASLTIKGHTP